MLKIYEGSEKDVVILKSFVMNDDLFAQIQEYVRQNNIGEGACFSVFDKTGRQLFLITYLEDLIAGIKRKDLSDYCDRCKNMENLDFTLLDQYQKFLFLSVDDYSIAVAKLLSECRPDKKIIFGDARAKYFFAGGNITYLSRFYNAARHMELTEEWMRGKGSAAFGDRMRAFIGWKILGALKKRRKCCIVKADRRNHPDEDGVVYNSQNVIYSLLWKKQERCFGGKNPDKKLVVLDYACDKEGLGSIAKCAFAHIMWMTRHGYVPVMNLKTYPNQYLNNSGENMWEYFFEPVSSVSVADACQSKNVVIATENDISWCDFHISPYQREYMKTFADAADFRKIVRFNQATRQHTEAKMPKEIQKGERVLGVVMRGTGFRKEVAQKCNKEWRKDIVEPDVFLRTCKQYKEKLQCSYIFLATEDAEYFEMAKNILGSGLLFIDQKRTDYDYAHKEEITLNEAMGLKDGKAAGRDYLSIIKSLTECTALLYNVECGAVRLAWTWKQGEYEAFQCITP